MDYISLGINCKPRFITWNAPWEDLKKERGIAVWNRRRESNLHYSEVGPMPFFYCYFLAHLSRFLCSEGWVKTITQYIES
jgi:hypothetical protein